MKTFKVQTETKIITTYEVKANNKKEAIKSFKNDINTKKIKTKSIIETIEYLTVLEDEFINENILNIHTDHCCINCGCKYGTEKCSVFLGELKQSNTCSYPCTH